MLGEVLVLASVASLAVSHTHKCRTAFDFGLKWTIDCSALNLSSAPPTLNLHPVEVLNMSRNAFVYLTESQFINWTDILRLDLSTNSIKAVDVDAFKGLDKLIELNLMENFIEVLSLDITTHLPKLQILNLSSNKLKSISAGTFEPVPALLKLYLRNNLDLGKVSSNYATLNVTLTKSLIVLDLANSSLEDIPNSFFDSAVHLISLNLAQNPLKVFQVLPSSLRHLNISETPIETIPQGLFLNSEVLQRLSLESMPFLKDIKANALRGLPRLRELYIRNCTKLSFISADAFGEFTPKLQSVVISHCALTTLPKTFQPLVEKAEHLDFQNNPWVCDGRIAWIANIRIDANLTEDLRCDMPSTAEGLPLVEYFKPQSLHPHSHLIQAGVIVTLVALLVTSVVAMLRHMSKPKVYRQLQDISLQERSQTAVTPL